MEMAVFFLTILSSAAAAGFTTYRLNVYKDRLFFRARKAEEIYRTAEALDGALTSYFGNSYSLIGNSQRPVRLEEMEKIGAHFVTLKMFVGFYFPSLRSELSRTISATTTAYGNLGAFEQAGFGDRQHLVKTLDATVCDLKDALEALKAAILKLGHSHDVARPFVFFRRSAKPMSAPRIMEVPV